MNLDTLVFSRGEDGQLAIDTPLVVKWNSSERINWPEVENRHNVLLAAQILYAFLQESRDPQLHRTPSSRFLALAQPFSRDFLDNQPLEGGIIPVEQIASWISRALCENSELDEVRDEFDEHSDHHDFGRVDNISALPFDQYGCVCQRTNETTPNFNIEQRIWLHKHIRMDWIGAPIVVSSLAANVIDRFLSLQAEDAPVRKKIRGDVGDLYLRFAEELIFGMPGVGGQIPVSVINCWFLRRV